MARGSTPQQPTRTGVGVARCHTARFRHTTLPHPWRCQALAQAPSGEFFDDAASTTSPQEIGSESGAGGVAPAGGTTSDQKAKGKDKAPKKKCKICQRALPMEDFALHSSFCRPDKQTVDNLAHQAKVQKEETWWQETRRDEARLRRVVRKYQEQCPRETGVRCRYAFAIVRYKEEYSASTAVRHLCRGRMMTKTRYVAWAMSQEGRHMTAKDAERQWTEWESDVDHIRDQKGPTEETLRLRVPMEDDVDFETTWSHSKTQELQAKRETKNVSEEEARRGRRGLLRGHERGLGKKGEEMEYGAIAQAMVTKNDGSAAAVGSVFKGAGVFVADVARIEEELAEEDAVATGGQEKATATAPATDASSVGDSVPPSKKRKWFDASHVTKRRRAVEDQNDKVVRAMEGALTAAEAKLAELQSLPDEEQKRYAAETATLTARLEWARVCLGLHPEATVPQLAAQVTSKSARPPCEDWESVGTTQDLLNDTASAFAQLDSVGGASSLDDVLAAVKPLEDRRAALVKLHKSVTKGVADVKAAQSTTARLQKQRAACAAKKSDKSNLGGVAPRDRVLVRPVFEHANACATEMQHFGTAEEFAKGNVDLASPVVVRDVRLAKILAEASERAARRTWIGVRHVPCLASAECFSSLHDVEMLCSVGTCSARHVGHVRCQRRRRRSTRANALGPHQR